MSAPPIGSCSHGKSQRTIRQGFCCACSLTGTCINRSCECVVAGRKCFQCCPGDKCKNKIVEKSKKVDVAQVSPHHGTTHASNSQSSVGPDTQKVIEGCLKFGTGQTIHQDKMSDNKDSNKLSNENKRANNGVKVVTNNNIRSSGSSSRSNTGSESYRNGSKRTSPTPTAASTASSSSSSNSVSSGSYTASDTVISKAEFDIFFEGAFGAKRAQPTPNAFQNMMGWPGRYHRCLQHLQSQRLSVPDKALGKEIIHTLAELMHEWCEDETQYAEKMLCFCMLVLQRDSTCRDAPSIGNRISEMLDLWKRNRYDECVDLALQRELTISSRYSANRPSIDSLQHKERVFTKLIHQGKTTEAVRFATRDVQVQVFPPHKTVGTKIVDAHSGRTSIVNKTVLKILKDKHLFIERSWKISLRSLTITICHALDPSIYILKIFLE